MLSNISRLSKRLNQALPRAMSTAATTFAPVTELTEDEKLMKESVSKWAKEVLTPRVRSMDEKATMDKDIIKSLFDNGFMGIEIPTEYGGSGASFMSAILAIEELAKVDPAVSVCCDVQNTLVNNVFSFWANDEIKSRIFPRLATQSIGSFCLSEPGSGSDAFALKTRADKHASGDYYTINGSKMWITNGGEADIFLVMANIDSSKGYKGITCFLVEKGTPGFTIGKKEDKLGIRASSTVSLSFEDVKVPKENIVGPVGQGYKIAIEILNEGRIGIGAQMLGLAEGAYESALPYIFQRKQFGQYVGDFQGIQHQYAQIGMEIEAAKLLVYNAARRKQAGLNFVKEAAMAKLYASQIAEKASSRAIEWMGGVGFTKDYPVEKFYRDSKIGAIYEGTTAVMLNTIALLERQKFTGSRR